MKWNETDFFILKRWIKIVLDYLCYCNFDLNLNINESIFILKLISASLLNRYVYVYINPFLDSSLNYNLK